VPALKSKFLRFAGANVLILFSLSAGFTVIHQCHSYIASHSGTEKGFVGDLANPAASSTATTLVNDVCAGAIFLILFFARKYFFKFSFLRLFSNSELTRWRALNFTRPPNLRRALTLSQLVVIRI